MKKKTKKVKKKYVRKKLFKAGQAVVYEPSWAVEKVKGGICYEKSPLRYGDIMHFLAYHEPAWGHCIVTTYEGKVITMLHPEDFRPATDNEV